MASNLKYASAMKKAKMDAITTYMGASPLLRIYSGSQPTDPDTSIGAATLLAELVMNATPFGAASGTTVVTITANAVANDASADATGTAAWFRIWKSNGTTPVIDGTVGTSGTDCIINNTSIAITQVVPCSSVVITAGN